MELRTNTNQQDNINVECDTRRLIVEGLELRDKLSKMSLNLEILAKGIRDGYLTVSDQGVITVHIPRRLFRRATTCTIEYPIASELIDTWRSYNKVLPILTAVDDTIRKIAQRERNVLITTTTNSSG